jgi:hypothetical protein
LAGRQPPLTKKPVCSVVRLALAQRVDADRVLDVPLLPAHAAADRQRGGRSPFEARVDAGRRHVPLTEEPLAAEQQVALLVALAPMGAGDDRPAVVEQVGGVDVEQRAVALDLAVTERLAVERQAVEADPPEPLVGLDVDVEVEQRGGGADQPAVGRPRHQPHPVLEALEVVGLLEEVEVEPRLVGGVLAQRGAGEERLEVVLVVADPLLQGDGEAVELELDAGREVVERLVDRAVELELVARQVERGRPLALLGVAVEAEVDGGQRADRHRQAGAVAHPLEVEVVEVAAVRLRDAAGPRRHQQVLVEVGRPGAGPRQVEGAGAADVEAQRLEGVAPEVRDVEVDAVDATDQRPLAGHVVEVEPEQPRALLEVDVLPVLALRAVDVDEAVAEPEAAGEIAGVRLGRDRRRDERGEE